jgi:hypothetical protein
MRSVEVEPLYGDLARRYFCDALCVACGVESRGSLTATPVLLHFVGSIPIGIFDSSLADLKAPQIVCQPNQTRAANSKNIIPKGFKICPPPSEASQNAEIPRRARAVATNILRNMKAPFGKVDDYEPPLGACQSAKDSNSSFV